MELKIIGSSSSGNAYLLMNAKEALLIECGVRFDLIKRSLSFNLAKVVGALITHSHNDHCASVHHVQTAGIDVYSSTETHEEMRTMGSHRTRFLHEGVEQSIGNFKVLPFRVEHDTGMPFGFIIYHEEMGHCLFLTDSFYSKYTFKNLNQIIVEANYSEEILNEKLLSEKKFLRDRVLQSHMSIRTCKDMLRANDLTSVNNIVLIHLSSSNSNAAEFKREVEEITGKTVTIAEPGITIPFGRTPY